MKFEEFFVQVKRLRPEARCILWVDGALFSVTIMLEPYPNWYRGTMFGSRTTDFAEPATGTWLLLAGEAIPGLHQSVQAIGAVSPTSMEVAMDEALAKLRAKLAQP